MKLICAGLCLLLCPLVGFTEQYLCVPDKMTGFAYDKTAKAWDIAQFKTNFKYVIAPAKNGRDTFALTKVGERNPEGYCKDGFNDAGILFCNTYGGDLEFNKSNGRYLAVFFLAYYNVGVGPSPESDADSGTPAMQIGKCSPF